MAELGAESLASDLDAAVEEGFVSLLHKEIRPLRTCIADTGKTVSSIAETLYQIQDGINNLCCNVTQMKSKVLSSDYTENLFEDDAGQEKDQEGLHDDDDVGGGGGVKTESRTRKWKQRENDTYND